MADQSFYQSDRLIVDALDNAKLNVRPLKLSDCDREDLLQLLYPGEPDRTATFRNLLIGKFERLKVAKLGKDIGMYYPTVIENEQTQIVAFGVLSVEQKLIHGCQLRGRIDDIVVSSERLSESEQAECRNFLVRCLADLGQRCGCYKISIAAPRHLASAYEPLFKVDKGNNVMTIDIVSH